MISLDLVTTPIQKETVKSIITTHHSYVPTHKSVGRRIDWLIHYQNRIVGMIGIGSSVYPPPKDLLNYLRLSKTEYKPIFNTIANNWRFCMSERIPNIGSQILKELRHHAPIEWEKKYNNELKYIMTFVGGNKNGAVYLADNWMRIGETSGLPPHKSSSMKWHNKEELKELFVKPTGENKKIIFIKEIK
jgi:hypothetical protein